MGNATATREASPKTDTPQESEAMREAWDDKVAEDGGKGTLSPWASNGGAK